jgi:hypothetical protein
MALSAAPLRRRPGRWAHPPPPGLSGPHMAYVPQAQRGDAMRAIGVKRPPVGSPRPLPTPTVPPTHRSQQKGEHL